MTDRFEWHRKLGEGGFGEVWSAYDRQLKREVAVKILRSDEPDARTRFDREARLLRRLDGHPNVLQLLDEAEHEGRPVLVVERCVGSLQDWVSRRPTWKVVARALQDAAQGLQAIHEIGGFHRDVKPGNLLWKKLPKGDWVVKVSDFGLARTPISGSGPMTRSAKGTPQYTAPEIFSGAEYHSGADVYSLGKTGVALLTGSLDPRAISSAKCPEALKALLRRMCAGEPLERPSMLEVSVALDEIRRSPAPLVAARSSEAGSASSDFLAGLAFVLCSVLLVVLVVALVKS